MLIPNAPNVRMYDVHPEICLIWGKEEGEGTCIQWQQCWGWDEIEPMAILRIHPWHGTSPSMVMGALRWTEREKKNLKNAENATCDTLFIRSDMFVCSVVICDVRLGGLLKIAK